MLSFRKTYFLLLLAISSSLVTSCGDDDVDDMLSNCPAPVDAFVMSNCLLDIPDMLRPEDQPDVTFQVELFKDNENYYYAFISSSISAQIEVYDACCNSVCSIGIIPGGGCDWQDTAEDLGTIWEE